MRVLSREWIRWALVAVLAALYSGWIVYEVGRDRLYDFNTYYIAASAFRRGIDVYDLADDYAGVNKARWQELAAENGITFHAPPYRYPPLTAQLILPLTYLPPLAAGAVWLALTAVAYLASAWALGHSGPVSHGFPLALALLVLFVPPLTTLHAGQVNGLVLLALCVSLYGLTTRRAFWGGLGAATGASLKLIPIALVAYLPWRRKWLAVAVALVCLAVPLVAAPATLGPGTLRAYARDFFAIGQPGTVFVTGANQSLNGMLGRLLDEWMDPGAIYLIYLAAAALVMLATVFCLWPPFAVQRPLRLEFGLIVCALQLITPYTWYHQLVLLLVPFFVLCCAVLDGQAPHWWLGPLAIGYLMTNVHGLAWHQLPDGPLLSMPFYTMVMLFAMLAWLIVQGRDQAAYEAVG